MNWFLSYFFEYLEKIKLEYLEKIKQVFLNVNLHKETPITIF